jgi:hypothetical protein
VRVLTANAMSTLSQFLEHLGEAHVDAYVCRHARSCPLSPSSDLGGVGDYLEGHLRLEALLICLFSGGHYDGLLVGETASGPRMTLFKHNCCTNQPQLGTATASRNERGVVRSRSLHGESRQWPKGRVEGDGLLDLHVVGARITNLWVLEDQTLDRLWEART